MTLTCCSSLIQLKIYLVVSNQAGTVLLLLKSTNHQYQKSKRATLYVTADYEKNTVYKKYVLGIKKRRKSVPANIDSSKISKVKLPLKSVVDHQASSTCLFN